MKPLVITCDFETPGNTSGFETLDIYLRIWNPGISSLYAVLNPLNCVKSLQKPLQLNLSIKLIILNPFFPSLFSLLPLILTLPLLLILLMLSYSIAFFASRSSFKPTLCHAYFLLVHRFNLNALWFKFKLNVGFHLHFW